MWNCSLPWLHCLAPFQPIPSLQSVGSAENRNDLPARTVNGSPLPWGQSHTLAHGLQGKPCITRFITASPSLATILSSLTTPSQSRLPIAPSIRHVSLASCSLATTSPGSALSVGETLTDLLDEVGLSAQWPIGPPLAPLTIYAYFSLSFSPQAAKSPRIKEGGPCLRTQLVAGT